MPTRKISDLHRPCSHPQHDPPKHAVLEDGLYEHECPSCHAKQTFVVSKPMLYG